MSNEVKYEGKGKPKSENLPQYGKKGHKPRKPYTRREISLDQIQTNDISYWNKTTGFKDVTKFNWDLIVARHKDPKDLFNESVNLEIPVELDNTINPTQIMVINFMMGPGWASNVDSAVNRGLAMLMSKIRASLSTSNIGFETADLGIYLSSTSSIAALIGYAKRVLESYTVWKDRNYAYPRALISAMGCDYQDIADNINTYTSRLNASIDMYNNMSLLDCFDIYDRQYSMCHNIFVDEDSQFGQLYIFRPVNYYLYTDDTTPNIAKFEAFDTSEGFEGILDQINTAIQAWYGSSDLYQINGVLLRAFKDAPRQIIPYFVQGEVINPVVDRAFLMQIMNCTIHNSIDYESCDITQDPTTQNYVIWKPAIVGLAEPTYTEVMLRVFEEDLNADDCMEMTRLLNFESFHQFSGGIELPHTDMQDCGSEIVTSIMLVRYFTQTGELSHVTLSSNAIVCTAQNIHTSIRQISALMPFRYIPTIHILVSPFVPNGDGSGYVGTVGDMYNWMYYNVEDWRNLQFVAYQSLWVPKNL